MSSSDSELESVIDVSPTVHTAFQSIASHNPETPTSSGSGASTPQNSSDGKKKKKKGRPSKREKLINVIEEQNLIPLLPWIKKGEMASAGLTRRAQDMVFAYKCRVLAHGQLYVYSPLYSPAEVDTETYDDNNRSMDDDIIEKRQKTALEAFILMCMDRKLPYDCRLTIHSGIRPLYEVVEHFGRVFSSMPSWVVVNDCNGLVNLKTGQYIPDVEESVLAAPVQATYIAPGCVEDPLPLMMGRLMADQGWSLEVVYLRMVMIGRYLANRYRLPQEQWQLVCFDVGASGVGKGVFYRFVDRFFSQTESGFVTLNPKSSSDFLLAPVTRASVRAAFINEYRGTCDHVTSQILQLAANEKIIINRKNLDHMQFQTRAALWGNGNQHMMLYSLKTRNPAEKQAAMRRYVPFVYRNDVRKPDHNMFEHLWETETSSIVYNSIRAYHEYVHQFDTALVLPKETLIARAESSGRINPATLFLRHMFVADTESCATPDDVNGAFATLCNVLGLFNPHEGIWGLIRSMADNRPKELKDMLPRSTIVETCMNSYDAFIGFRNVRILPAWQANVVPLPSYDDWLALLPLSDRHAWITATGTDGRLLTAQDVPHWFSTLYNDSIHARMRADGMGTEQTLAALDELSDIWTAMDQRGGTTEAQGPMDDPFFFT